MIKLIIQKMVNSKWLVLCLIIGCALAVSVAAVIPMYADSIMQRMLIKDFETHQQKTRLHPMYTRFDTKFSNVEDSDEKLQLFHFFNDRIVKDMAPEVPMDIIYSYVSVASEDKIYMDSRNWPRYLEDIQKGVRYRRGKTGHVDARAVNNLEDMLDIVSGKFPEPGSVYIETEDFQGRVYEVVISQAGMEANEYSFGNIYTMTYNDQDERYILNYKVVGVANVNSEAAPYFIMDKYGIYFDYDTFFNDVLYEHKMAVSHGVWHYSYDFYGIAMADVPNMLDDLDDNYAWMKENGDHLMQTTSYDATLKEYLGRSDELSALLLLLVMPVIIMIGFYITMITQLMIENERNEIALLESRGTSRRQIMNIYLAESAVIGFVSWLFGLGTAYILAKITGASSGFMEFVDRSSMKTVITGDSLLYGAICSVLFVSMMMIPAYKASKFTIVQHKQGRVVFSKKPFWQRFYLDVLLLAVSAYVMSNYNMVMDKVNYIEEGKVDYLIFFVMTFFILGVGMVFIRLYPYLIYGFFRIGRRHWPAPMYAALTSVAKGNPMRSFIMIFLILTIGIGIFSANSVRTINSNIEDRIRYGMGAQIVMKIARIGNPDMAKGFISNDFFLRIEDSMEPGEKEEIFIELAKKQGIDSITKVGSGLVIVNSYEHMGPSVRHVNMMAVTPEEFGEVLWYREDLYDTHINHYLNLLARYPDGIIVSRGLAEKTKAVPGEMMAVNIDGYIAYCPLLAVVDYWPSYDKYELYTERGQELCVMHYMKLVATIGMQSDITWIKKSEGVLDSEFSDMLRSMGVTVFSSQFTDHEVKQAMTDPLLIGMNGILTLDFLITMLICGVGFIIYWILSIRQRVLQFGIFRAMGMRKRELVTIIIWEQLLLSGAAVIMGILIGGLASEWFIPLFDIANDAKDRVIPFVLVNDRTDYYRIYAFIFSVLALGTAAIARFAIHIKMDQAVKLGED